MIQMLVNHMKKFLLSCLAIGFFHACSLDPDPGSQLPEPIRSYFLLYNYFQESYDLLWEVEGYTLSAAHTYGGSIMGFVHLDSTAGDITFTTKHPDTGEMILSGNYRLEENKFTMVAVMGNEEDPYLSFDPLNLDPPGSGMIRIRFMHTSGYLDPLDVYIGGSSEDKRVVSNLTYRQVSGYVETSLNDLLHSVVVLPHGSTPGTDSALISNTGSNVLHPDRIYLGVIGHPGYADTTTVDLVFYDQPVEY